MILANDQVEVFDNTIEKNQTGGLSIISYLFTGREIKDEKFDPFCEAIHIHDNRFAGNGGKPSGTIGEMLTKVLGATLPDILYDGIVDPKKLVDGKLPDCARDPHSQQRRGRIRQLRRAGPGRRRGRLRDWEGAEHRPRPEGLLGHAADVWGPFRSRA